MSSEYWQGIFEDVRKNVMTYLSSDLIKSKYKNMATEVDFFVDDLNHEVNASAKKIGNHEYKITINAGLVACLREYSENCIEQGWVFTEQIKEDNELKLKASDLLMYIWLDFICFHEWAHIICGHLEFEATSSGWHEFWARGKSNKSNLENMVVQRLEAEADSFAAKFSLARFSTIWEHYSKDFSLQKSNEVALENYFITILLLYKLFEEIETKNNQEKTHPEPFIRSFITHAFMLGEFGNIPGLPNISKDSIEMVFGKVFAIFHMEHFNLSPEDLIVKSLNAAQFMESVDPTLKKLGISERRIAIK